MNLPTLVLRQTRIFQRDADEARLQALLCAYRDSHQSPPSTAALAAALHRKLLALAPELLKKHGLPRSEAEDLSQAVLTRWQHQGGLLKGWSAAGGASISTYSYKALEFACLEQRKKTVYDLASEEEIANLPEERDQSPSSRIRVHQVSQRLDLLAREMVGKMVAVEDGNGISAQTLLTANHRHTLEKIVELGGDPSDQQLADALKMPKAKAGRWRRAVYAYIRQHPQRDEIIELLKPTGN